MALMCLGQAEDKLVPTKDAVQGNSIPNVGTIIVNRQWSFGAAAQPNWKFNVDNGPDLIVRNGTYLRVDVPPGDHILDHKHMILWGSDPQTVHVKAGEMVYFQSVEAMSVVFEVADDQAQAARTVSKMRSVAEALDHSRLKKAADLRIHNDFLTTPMQWSKEKNAGFSTHFANQIHDRIFGILIAIC